MYRSPSRAGEHPSDDRARRPVAAGRPARGGARARGQPGRRGLAELPTGPAPRAHRRRGRAPPAKLVAEAWQSFARSRPEEPPLDERVRRLLQTELPSTPGAAHEAVDDAARILDESIAQPRPRYFVGVGSSGLEIGTIGDLLAHTYDINLAVDARAATLIEKQAVRWAAEFIGYAPDAA